MNYFVFTNGVIYVSAALHSCWMGHWAWAGVWLFYGLSAMLLSFLESQP